MQKISRSLGSLPATEQLLLAGGDARIAVDPLSGQNKYGCSPFPDPQLLAFGSSTASNISTEGYAAANRLRQRLLTALSTETHAEVYALEMQGLQLEWRELCELSGMAGIELVISESGTDLHAIVAHYAACGAVTSALIIMVAADETGSGVASALNGNPGEGTYNADVVQVSIRLGDGAPRCLAEIDAEVEMLVSKAVASDRRVLLIQVDQSKTGLIAPSPGCVIALHQRYPENVDVLVDACQFRIGMPTLHAYLEQGFMVALTGSKFLTGPSFSAALVLPETAVQRLKKLKITQSFTAHRADNLRRAWQRSVIVRPELVESGVSIESSEPTANFGLLLRSAVALDELRRFRVLPESVVIACIEAFAEAISQRLKSDPHFEALAVPQIDRRPLTVANNWDHLQTIFPFLLYDPTSVGRIPLNREQTRNVYQQLQSKLCPDSVGLSESAIAAIRCQLGQPVACGTRNGIPVSALRLCISSRLLVEAATRGDKGEAIIKAALKTLDKTALLIQQSPQL